MWWILVLLGAAVMLALAVVVGWALGLANRRWQVLENPLVHKVWQRLPHLDCGACGYANCHAYANALVHDRAPTNLCRPGGEPTAEAVATTLGVEVQKLASVYAVVHCGARPPQKQGMRPYDGGGTCAAANLAGSVQACAYGCLGLGDCERSCPFDAIHVIDGLAVVDYHKCTACGNCVDACPRNIINIESFPHDDVVVVACCNRDGGKQTRAVCDVGCIACGVCQKNCKLFKVEGNLSHLDYSRYDSPDAAGLAAAQAKCPTKCLPSRGKTLRRNGSS